MKILVTGAGRGLGLEIVTEALNRGHEVVAGIRSLDTNLEVLEGLQKKAPGRLTLLELDVDDEESVVKAKQAMQGIWEGLDVLVNNAGIVLAREQSIEKLEFAAVENTFRTNLYGPMKMVKHFLSMLRASSSPCILNISSESGCFAHAYGGDYSYALSKNAINFFSAQLRKELTPQGFMVYSVHPGWIRTSMGGWEAPGNPEDSARGIVDLLERKIKLPTEEAIMIDYKGQAMPF